jgi:hypothetical protein
LEIISSAPIERTQARRSGPGGDGQDQHRHPRPVGAQVPDELRADAVGQQEVHDGQVDPLGLLGRLAAGLGQRPGLGDDLEVGLAPEQVGEGLAEPRVVLEQENAGQAPSPLSPVALLQATLPSTFYAPDAYGIVRMGQFMITGRELPRTPHSEVRRTPPSTHSGE